MTGTGAAQPQCRRVLVTAFEPFGGETQNSSLAAVREMPEQLGGIHVHKVTVPTTFRESARPIYEALTSFNPDAVLCVGQASGRASVGVERVAINLIDARIPDNEGQQPVDKPIVEDGPAAYFSTLPVKAMVAAIRAEGVPAEVSHSAGTFVCNQLMYSVLHRVRGMGIRAGFVHIPAMLSQVTTSGSPSLPTSDAARALSAAVTALATHTVDIASAEGTLH